MSVVRRKTIVQLGSLGECCKPSPVGSRDKAPENFGYLVFWTSSKHCSCHLVTANGDESLHQKSTLLRVWGSEFGISNLYTSFKIALDTALANPPSTRPHDKTPGPRSYVSFCCCCVFLPISKCYQRQSLCCFLWSSLFLVSLLHWVQFQSGQEILLIVQGKIRESCLSFFVATLYRGIQKTIKMIEIDYIWKCY